MSPESASVGLVAAVLPTVITGVIGWLIKNAFGGMKTAIVDLTKEVKELNTKLSGHDTRIETSQVRLAVVEKEQERQVARHHELATRFQTFIMDKAASS
jgi:hypothetical protein